MTTPTRKSQFTSSHLEIAAMRYFNPRVNIIVPNVSWGLQLHECDLLVLTPAGIAYEVEIKISKSDIIADKKKPHGHNNKKIGKLFFCVPNPLADFALQHIPERAGLLVVESWQSLWAQKIKDARLVSDYRWSEQQRLKLAHLGCMRLLPLLDNLRQLTIPAEWLDI